MHMHRLLEDTDKDFSLHAQMWRDGLLQVHHNWGLITLQVLMCFSEILTRFLKLSRHKWGIIASKKMFTLPLIFLSFVYVSIFAIFFWLVFAAIFTNTGSPQKKPISSNNNTKTSTFQELNIKTTIEMQDNKFLWLIYCSLDILCFNNLRWCLLKNVWNMWIYQFFTIHY